MMNKNKNIAMQKALEHVLEFGKGLWLWEQDYNHKWPELKQEIEDALSLPDTKRNCDVFNKINCTEAFAKEMDDISEFKSAEEENEYMKNNWFLFKHWLFSPAKYSKQ